MKCRKEIVLTGYRVQYIDLRKPKHSVELDLRKLWESAESSATGEQAVEKVLSYE